MFWNSRQIIFVNLIFHLLFIHYNSAMPKVVDKIVLNGGIGTKHQILVHKYTPVDSTSTKKAYIQASLHADEIPGILVSHHLIHLLDAAAEKNEIQQEIIVIPYANPIGLSQYLLGSQIGRFSIKSGINFNRDWPDLTTKISESIKDKLIINDAKHNVQVIRAAMIEELNNSNTNCIDKIMKNSLYKLSCDADLVLDLHCDSSKLKITEI